MISHIKSHYVLAGTWNNYPTISKYIGHYEITYKNKQYNDECAVKGNCNITSNHLLFILNFCRKYQLLITDTIAQYYSQCSSEESFLAALRHGAYHYTELVDFRDKYQNCILRKMRAIEDARN